MAYSDDTESNPFLGYVDAPKDSLFGGSSPVNGASLNGASLNGASLNGSSLNGASLNGSSLSSFHSHFHKAAVAQSPIEVTRHLISAVNSVSSDTPSHVKQEYFNLAKAMVDRRSNTTLPSLNPTRVALDSNLESLISSHPRSKFQIHNEIARRSIGLSGFGFEDSLPKWAKFLAIGVVVGCAYKKFAQPSS